MSWSRTSALFLLLSLVVLTTSACTGFRPLYARDAGGSVAAIEMAKIEIGLIPDRPGQQLRNNLLDLMNPRGEPGAPSYRLNVSLSLSTEGLGLRKSGFATRANLHANASLTLVDAKTGKTLLTGSHRIIGGYDLLDSEFATLASEKYVQARTMVELAHAIRTQVSVFFLQRAERTKRP